STKLEVRSDTPAFFSTHSMVSGRVADDEAEEKAVSMAGATARKCAAGFTRRSSLSTIGKATKVCTASASTTVKKNTSIGRKAAKPVLAMVSATRPKTP